MFIRKPHAVITLSTINNILKKINTRTISAYSHFLTCLKNFFLRLCLSHQSELSPFIAFDCCVFQVYFDIKHLLHFPFHSGFWFVWETWRVFWMMSYTVDLAEGFLMVPLFTPPLFSLPPVEAGLDQVPFCLQGLGNQPGSSRWRQMKPSVFPRTATQEIVLCDLLWGRR